MIQTRMQYWEGEKKYIEKMFFSPRGATLQMVADKYGISKGRVHQLIKLLGIKTIPRSEALVLSIERMIGQGVPVLKIAQSLGIPQSRVRNYISKFRIKNFSIKQKIQQYLKQEDNARLHWLYNNLKRKRRVTDEERFDMLLNLELPKYCPVTFIEIDYNAESRCGYQKDRACLYKFKKNGRNNLNNCAVISHFGTRVPRHGSFEDVDLFEEWVREEKKKRRA